MGAMEYTERLTTAGKLNSWKRTNADVLEAQKAIVDAVVAEPAPQWQQDITRRYLDDSEERQRDKSSTPLLLPRRLSLNCSGC